MPSVRSAGNVVTHPSLPGVTIIPVGGSVEAGKKQTVLVHIGPRGSIARHSHTVDAEMVIVDGDGWVCSTDSTNGRHVSRGARVFYEADKPHGFRAGDYGLSFISINGGIVDRDPEKWDLKPANP